MRSPRRIRSTDFLLVPLWVDDAVGRDCSTMRVYLTILKQDLVNRTAPRNLKWLIDATGFSRSTVYDALAQLRDLGIVVETDTEWWLPRDQPVSDLADESSDLADRSSGGSDDALSLEGLEGGEGTSTDVDASADPEYGFDHFWAAWPARNGKKLNKAKAVAQWRRLSLDDKKAAWRGAKNYAAASEARIAGAMDAFRWLRDRLWVEWQTPATPDAKTKTRSNGMLDLVRQERGA